MRGIAVFHQIWSIVRRFWNWQFGSIESNLDL
jgi:hypothetical protein